VKYCLDPKPRGFEPKEFQDRKAGTFEENLLRSDLRKISISNYFKIQKTNKNKSRQRIIHPKSNFS